MSPTVMKLELCFSFCKPSVQCLYCLLVCFTVLFIFVRTVHTCRIVLSHFRILNPDTASSSTSFLRHIVISLPCIASYPLYSHQLNKSDCRASHCQERKISEKSNIHPLSIVHYIRTQRWMPLEDS